MGERLIPDLDVSEVSTCLQCGARLSGDGPAGSCPACLLSLALGVPPQRLDHGDPAVPGRALRRFGDYELLAEIQRGGIGVLYRARPGRPNRTVALKMVLTGQQASAASLQRFHTEAEAAARLDHPHLVPIYEIGEYDGQHYFTMKLIGGGTLGSVRPG